MRKLRTHADQKRAQMDKVKSAYENTEKKYNKV